MSRHNFLKLFGVWFTGGGHRGQRFAITIAARDCDEARTEALHRLERDYPLARVEIVNVARISAREPYRLAGAA